MEQFPFPSRGLQGPKIPPPPLFFQLRVHVEFLPDLFPAADLGGICVRDLFLREGESSSHLSPRRLLPSLSSPLIGAPPRSHPRGQGSIMLGHDP